MTRSVPDDARSLAAWRGYLLVLAEGRLDERIRGKLEVEALVEEALTQAGQTRELYADQAPVETLRHLRKALAEALVNAARKDGLITGVGRSKLSSVVTALSASSERLERFVRETPGGPDNAASRVHSLLKLADAIASLPPAERRVIQMRCLQNLPVSEISERLGTDDKSVASLIARMFSPAQDRNT